MIPLDLSVHFSYPENAQSQSGTRSRRIHAVKIPQCPTPLCPWILILLMYLGGEVLVESAKAGLAFGGYETQNSGYEMTMKHGYEMTGEMTEKKSLYN